MIFCLQSQSKVTLHSTIIRFIRFLPFIIVTSNLLDTPTILSTYLCSVHHYSDHTYISWYPNWLFCSIHPSDSTSSTLIRLLTICSLRFEPSHVLLLSIPASGLLYFRLPVLMILYCIFSYLTIINITANFFPLYWCSPSCLLGW